MKLEKIFLNKNFSMFVTIILFLLLFIIGAVVFYPKFGTMQVFMNLFVDNAYLIIVSVGITFVLISGGIDISVGSLVAFTCVLSAFLLDKGANPFFVIVLMLAIGTFGGFIMGCMIHYFKIQPFITTLAFQFLYRGLCYVISINSISITNKVFNVIATHKIPFLFGSRINISVIISVLVVAIAALVLKYTNFGRATYAVGGNEQSASLMGLSVARTKVGVYMVSGFCGALGGIVYSFYTLSGYGLQNIGMEMEAIASAVIGGTLITGGVGNVIGTMFGTLIQGIIQTLVIFKGDLNSWWTKVTVAALLCIFILFQRIIVIRREKYKEKN